jgi:hypothetical protein
MRDPSDSGEICLESNGIEFRHTVRKVDISAIEGKVSDNLQACAYILYLGTPWIEMLPI